MSTTIHSAPAPTTPHRPAVGPAIDEHEPVPVPSASPAADGTTSADASIERSYFRSVGIAWLLGVPVMATIVTLITLAVGDLGVGGSIAVGIFAGIWASPMVAVVGIGVWAAKHHGPHG